MDRDQIVDRIAHAIRMQQAVQTTSFPATPERLAEAALGVVEDTYDSSAAASAVWDQAVAKCIEAINNLDPQTGDDVGSFRAALNDSIAALRSLKRSDKTESDNGGCQADAGAKGDTVSAPMEPLQSDIIADAALIKALGSVAWLADQEYRNDHSDSSMIATGLLRELRDGYQRIAEQRRKPTIGLRTDAMDHLGEVLSFFANLDEGDRCRALEEAIAFYNKHNPDSKIQGEPGFTWYICQRSPLGFNCRHPIEEAQRADTMPLTSGETPDTDNQDADFPAVEPVTEKQDG